MVDDFNKNCKLAEKEDFIRSEQVSWTNNPLFFSDNTQRDSELHSFMPANERLKKAGQHETGLKNTEFETESGYSETVSVLSELSSPSQSVSSYVSFSEEENDLIDEITENMRQASVVRTPCKDVDGNAGVTNAAQIVSSKGTVRGVKNRVRDNILHFLSGSQSDSKKYAKKNDANTVWTFFKILMIFTTQSCSNLTYIGKEFTAPIAFSFNMNDLPYFRKSFTDQPKWQQGG